MAEAVDPPFDRPDSRFNLLEGWTWIGCYGGYYLQADLLAAFEHGFFTRQWQGRGPEVLAGYVSAGVSVHRPKQVHSALVLPASAAAAEPWPEADGLVSDAGGQSLWVCGADCTPVLIADPVSGRVAACHAGWRGVAGGILLEAIAQFEAAGCSRSDLLVALGPAVSGERYQVELGVAQQVADALPMAAGGGATGAAMAELERCGALLSDPEPGRCRLDIRASTRRQLELAGVPAEQISVCPLCTVGEELLFHSWRRDQVKAVQWSGIVSQQLPS
ncbi:MAG: peptidoglycan editing factor PgeF [Cyanobacteria bacterium K_DeepCast_35m_m1_288]|nr:peptidoglycan editing factor PgeF [Cyanobacteria bacterium K_DeepCast_35m_m1_288]